MPIRYHWYLIDVLAAHQFKRLDRGCFRRNCPQLSKRAHHALYAGLRPSVPIDSLHFMRRNQSDQVIVLHDDEAAASGAQQVFIDEVLQVQEALDGSAVTIHEIGNTAPAQAGHALAARASSPPRSALIRAARE